MVPLVGAEIRRSRSSFSGGSHHEQLARTQNLLGLERHEETKAPRLKNEKRERLNSRGVDVQDKELESAHTQRTQTESKLRTALNTIAI
jgi:hypothetical protein